MIKIKAKIYVKFAVKIVKLVTAPIQLAYHVIKPMLQQNICKLFRKFVFQVVL